MAAIGDHVDTVGTWNPASSSGQFTYVDLGSVDQRIKVVVNPAVIPCQDAPSRARQLIAAGDVLVSTVRPNLNAVAHVPPELDGATASTGFTVLRASGDLDSRYLFHWVRTSQFVDEMVRRSTGASYPAVSDKIVKLSTMPLPPIEEQRRIAAVLDAADALRTKRRQAVTKLDTLTQASFIDMFGSATGGSSEFPMVEIGDVCLVKGGKRLPKGSEYAHRPMGHPYLRVVTSRTERSIPSR